MREERGHYTLMTKWFLACESRDQLVPRKMFLRHKDKKEDEMIWPGNETVAISAVRIY